jgi:hypothetical protein
VKQKLKNRILKVVNKPTPGVLSSQTLYECLFYLLNTNADYVVAKDVAERIVQTQLPDGGFDIGYQFNFGPNLGKRKAREGTSPEMLSVTALALFRKQFGDDGSVVNAIQKGVKWINDRMVQIGTASAIPYAPDSFDGVHITNATSFCLSAVASSIDLMPVELRSEMKLNVERMYEFMCGQLIYLSKKTDEAYWPYFYKTDNPEHAKYTNEKIDNYHMAQQLVHHCIANEFIPSSTNEHIIRVVAKYLLGQLRSDGYLPYTIYRGKVSDKVHLWGYSSLIGAFVRAYHIVGDDAYKEAAIKVRNYILEYGVADDHFAAVITDSNKSQYDCNFYPRSDAWVLHSLSELESICAYDDDSKIICERVFDKIRLGEFVGLENHALTYRMRLFAFLVRKFVH